MQVLEYPQTKQMESEDVFLIDGTKGTRTATLKSVADRATEFVDPVKARGSLDINSATEATSQGYEEERRRHLTGLFEDVDGNYYKVPITRINQIAADQFSGPIYHKLEPRQRNLGSVVTDEQWAAIDDGSFDDLFVGDYWRIGDISWRIVDIDYWLYTGESGYNCTKNHLVIMPDSGILNCKMTENSSATGGYYNSTLRNVKMSDIEAIVNAAFPSSHILNHKEIFVNETDNNGGPSGIVWADSKIEVPNQAMLFGSRYLSVGHDSCISKTQLMWFSLWPGTMYANRTTFWTRDVTSSNTWAVVRGQGQVSTFHGNDETVLVRPVFGICA